MGCHPTTIARFCFAIHKCIDHIERALGETNGGRVEPPGWADFIEWQLRGPVENMPDLVPMDQVAAMKYWETGKIFERRGNQIIVILHPANRWVGVKAGQDWIAKGS